MNILELNNVCKKYGDKSVLSNISFQVNSGEIVGLVGPNGAGKTTIFKVLSGLVNNDTGEVKRKGDIAGIVSKTPLYPFLTGKEHLKYIAKINSKVEIDYLEQFIGIGKQINNKVKTYSLGMKQRLCLVLVLLNDPEIILLDEPTNGLDNDGIRELRSLLRALSEERKKTIIISSHNLREIDILCNKIIFINNGKVVRIIDKTTANLKKSFQIKFKTNEISSIADLKGKYNLVINENVVRLTVDEEEVKSILKFIVNNVKFENLEIVNIDTYDLEGKYNLYINEGEINGAI